MERYKNSNGDSSISGYEIGADFIKVEFAATRHVLKFSYRSAGKNHVEKMKLFAVQGSGLRNYIENHMRVR